MDEKSKIIMSTIAEYLESAKDDEQKGRINAAVIMYFKALVELCDFIIYSQILKLPSNHTERFEMLMRFFPNIYKEVSPLFKIYRKTYSQKTVKEELEKVKDGTNKIIKETEIDKHLQEFSKK